jgi:hypothetical protein
VRDSARNDGQPRWGIVRLGVDRVCAGRERHALKADIASTVHCGITITFVALLMHGRRHPIHSLSLTLSRARALALVLARARVLRCLEVKRQTFSFSC